MRIRMNAEVVGLTVTTYNYGVEFLPKAIRPPQMAAFFIISNVG